MKRLHHERKQQGARVQLFRVQYGLFVPFAYHQPPIRTNQVVKKRKKAGYFFNPQTLAEESESSSSERPTEGVPSPAETQERTKALLQKARGGK